MFVGADVVLAPELSVATAVKVNIPAGTLLIVKTYGAVESSPSLLPFEKNSTRVIVPLYAEAVIADTFAHRMVRGTKTNDESDSGL